MPREQLRKRSGDGDDRAPKRPTSNPVEATTTCDRRGDSPIYNSGSTATTLVDRGDTGRGDRSAKDLSAATVRSEDDRIREGRHGDCHATSKTRPGVKRSLTTHEDDEVHQLDRDGDSNAQRQQEELSDILDALEPTSETDNGEPPTRNLGDVVTTLAARGERSAVEGRRLEPSSTRLTEDEANWIREHGDLLPGGLGPKLISQLRLGVGRSAKPSEVSGLGSNFNPDPSVTTRIDRRDPDFDAAGFVDVRLDLDAQQQASKKARLEREVELAKERLKALEREKAEVELGTPAVQRNLFPVPGVSHESVGILGAGAGPVIIQHSSDPIQMFLLEKLTEHDLSAFREWCRRFVATKEGLGIKNAQRAINYKTVISETTLWNIGWELGSEGLEYPNAYSDEGEPTKDFKLWSYDNLVMALRRKITKSVANGA
jgi:hypothetical protein